MQKTLTRPSSRQRVVIRRHFVQVLSSRKFRDTLKALRRRLGMTRLQLGAHEVWVIPQSRIANFRPALRRFGQRFFRGLGGEWAASRLVYDALWETRPLPEVVEEIASVMERLAASEDGWRADQEKWRQKKWPRVHSTHTGYYAGKEFFQPTVIWGERDLAEDLRTAGRGHVVPSDGKSPWVRPTRSFIEHFPWTEEGDILRAFRLTRRFQLRMLPRKAQLNRDPSESLQLYQGFCNGNNMKELVRSFSPKGDAARDLRRYVSRVASLFSLPEPTALRKIALEARTEGAARLGSGNARAHGERDPSGGETANQMTIGG